MAESIADLERKVMLARTELKNLRQQMASLKQEHIKEVTKLKFLISNGVPTTASTLGSDPSTSDEALIYRPIGHIETAFHNKRAVPRQPSVSAACRGRVVLDTRVFSNPAHACDGLHEFSHMWIIFHMHMTESNSTPAKVAPPRLRGERRGVFATRSPHRPCPIGLSLVKIVSVQGNAIEFSGVDMVSRTPVLDIKPYIPQYDYPVLRPAEGDGEADDSGAPGGDARLSPRVSEPTGTDQDSRNTTDGSDSPDGPDVSGSTPLSLDSPSAVDALAEFDNLNTRSPSRPGERGAPDGQEHFTPPQSANTIEGVRVPSWITETPVQNLEVIFTDDVIARLTQLIGERAEAFRTSLQRLLSEDPRSNYVRSRYPDHEYSCVLEDLSISCVFDSRAGVCTVVAVRNADEMQT